MKKFICFSGDDLWALDSEYRPLAEEEFTRYFDSQVYIPLPSEEGQVYLVDLDECADSLPVAGYLHDMRSLYLNGSANDGILKLCASARGYLEWYRSSRFCGHCGTKTSFNFDIKAAECSGCGAQIFPRVSPCVIVLVHDNGKILLANNVKYRTRKLYSILAGFVDPGESMEEAAHREIYEETGLRVKNLKYVKSQSWPFPQQLMCAFTAEYESGIINLQEEELTHAAWFDGDHLPEIPGRGSVAGELIRDYFNMN